ncbi:MAG: L-threonylcarbamoyladenylate synthase [Candidatus Gottesmanbacteria bacterium]
MIQNEEHIIQQAITVLNNGGIVIFPTDTAFGVGCRIDNKDAIDRVFQIRNRPMTQPLPVLVSSAEQSLTYFSHPSDIVRRFMDTYWPGALTIVDTCKKDAIYSPIRAGGDTVGLRWPRHELLQRILEGVGIPIVGPSANIHGQATPYMFDDLDLEFVSRVDFVVPGTCSVGRVSTVVDCSVEPYRIIRQGAVRL